MQREDDQRGADEDDGDVRRFKAGEAAVEVGADAHDRSAGEPVAGEGEAEDEAADHKEQLHTAGAVVDYRVEECSNGLTARLVLYLNADVEEDDGQNGDEAEAVDFGQVGAS